MFHSILDKIITATHVNLQPGDVLFLDIGQPEDQIEPVDDNQRQLLQKELNAAFGHEVKFILTCGITPTVISSGPKTNVHNKDFC